MQRQNDTKSNTIWSVQLSGLRLWICFGNANAFGMHTHINQTYSPFLSSNHAHSLNDAYRFTEFVQTHLLAVIWSTCTTHVFNFGPAMFSSTFAKWNPLDNGITRCSREIIATNVYKWPNVWRKTKIIVILNTRVWFTARIYHPNHEIFDGMLAISTARQIRDGKHSSVCNCARNQILRILFGPRCVFPSDLYFNRFTKNWFSFWRPFKLTSTRISLELIIWSFSILTFCLQSLVIAVNHRLWWWVMMTTLEIAEYIPKMNCIFLSSFRLPCQWNAFVAKRTAMNNSGQSKCGNYIKRSSDPSSIRTTKAAVNQKKTAVQLCRLQLFKNCIRKRTMLSVFWREVNNKSIVWQSDFNAAQATKTRMSFFTI